jgi:hypothetical protein
LGGKRDQYRREEEVEISAVYNPWLVVGQRSRGKQTKFEVNKQDWEDANRSGSMLPGWKKGYRPVRMRIRHARTVTVTVVLSFGAERARLDLPECLKGEEKRSEGG